MFWPVVLILGLLVPITSFRGSVVGTFLRMIRITEARDLSIKTLSWPLIKAQRSSVLLAKVAYDDDDDEARRQKKRLYKKRLSRTISNFRTEEFLSEDFKQNSGIDEHIPYDPKSKSKDDEVVMNITRFTYLMDILNKLESPDIGDIQKMRIVEKYIRDKSPKIYVNNITAGGLFGQWENDKKYWWDN